MAESPVSHKKLQRQQCFQSTFVHCSDFRMDLQQLIDSFQAVPADELRGVCVNNGLHAIERIMAANALLLREETLPGMSTRFESLFGRLTKDALLAVENEIPRLAPASCRALALEMNLRQMKTAQWFVHEKGNGQTGPMDFLALDAWVRNAKFRVSTEDSEMQSAKKDVINVWREGWPNWVPLSRCGFLTMPYFFKAEPVTPFESSPQKAPDPIARAKFPFILGFTEVILVPVWFILIFVAPWSDSASIGRAVHFILPLCMTGFSILTAIGFWASGAWAVHFKLGTSVIALIYLLVAIFADDRGFLFKFALGLHLLTLFIVFNFYKNNPTS